jgi:D-sedoheptulose 7-phosphate isomerase
MYSPSTTDSSLTTSIAKYFDQLQQALRKLETDPIARLAEVLLEANRREATIFIFGNGGSAATATHFANDLAKGCVVAGCKRFRAISLTDNVALMTAWANDTGYENIFAEQLKGLAYPGDVVIGISGSGNSPNVLKAIAVGQALGLYTIGLSGFGGGQLAGLVDLALCTDCMVMEQVEDVHAALCHNLATTLRAVLTAQATALSVARP